MTTLIATCEGVHGSTRTLGIGMVAAVAGDVFFPAS
jgi:hypothetical protein